MRTAIGEMVVIGVKTNLDFQYSILNNEFFEAGEVDTGFVERFLKGDL